jgi:hypothetical protein
LRPRASAASVKRTRAGISPRLVKSLDEGALLLPQKLVKRTQAALVRQA